MVRRQTGPDRRRRVKLTSAVHEAVIVDTVVDAIDVTDLVDDELARSADVL
jgi:hypothetical protein